MSRVDCREPIGGGDEKKIASLVMKEKSKREEGRVKRLEE